MALSAIEANAIQNRFSALETALNDVQTALNNLATRTQMKSLVNIRQAEIIALREQFEQLEITAIGPSLTAHKEDPDAHCEIDGRYFLQGQFVQTRAGDADRDKPVILNSDGYLDSSFIASFIASGVGSEGNMSGPGTSTDEALVRWDGTSGIVTQNSPGTNLTDTGFLTLDGGISCPDPSYAGSERFGSGATVGAINTTSFGAGADAGGIGGTAIGQGTSAGGNNSLAFGFNSNATGATSIALGSTSISGGSRSVSLGPSAQSAGDDSAAFGANATAPGDNSVALGKTSAANFIYSIAIGRNSLSAAEGAVAIGYLSDANGLNSVSIGRSSDAVAAGSVALGDTANAAGANSVSIASNSAANSDDSIAIGNAADVATSSDGSIAIGANSSVTHANAIALGDSAISTAIDRMTLGVAGTPVDFEMFGMLGVGIAPGSAMIHTQADAAGTVGAIVQAAAAQTANIQEWQTSAGANLAAVDEGGNISLTAPAQYVGQNVGGTFVGMRMPSAGLVELYGSNSLLASFDTIRTSFTKPIAWTKTGALAGTVFESIKNLGAFVGAGDVVVMSGGTTEVTIATSANQQGVMVALAAANTNQNTKIADAGIVGVYVVASGIVAPGDKLVSSATAGTAEVDNAETDCSKIIGYAWENTTVGATRETVLCKLI